ncbi:MAG: cyanophycin synthetase, partial [candidate division WOR-3 bacterium]
MLNALAVFGIARALGWELEPVVAGIERLDAVPGRLERIEHSGNFHVYVDYAHTPDALRKVLETVREWTSNRVIVVFGCGGDRDRGKRPLMGKVATQMADIVIITSDNPRSEEPAKIIEEILMGVAPVLRQDSS